MYTVSVRSTTRIYCSSFEDAARYLEDHPSSCGAPILIETPCDGIGVAWLRRQRPGSDWLPFGASFGTDPDIWIRMIFQQEKQA